MTKVLITGAAGFVGSHLAQECLERGYAVTGIDSLTTYYHPETKRRNVAALEGRPGWTFIVDDLLQVDLASLLDGIDVVFHAAAQPGIRSSWGDHFQAYVDSNVSALQRLLEAARSAGLHRFVFASSSSVYGDAETMPTSEDTPLRPVSPYGATKALGEHLCNIYHRSYKLPVVILRFFTVYGPRQRPDMAFHRLISAALENDEIVIYGDGHQTRDFTYVQDIVAGTLAAGQQGIPGAVYNLGGGTRTSVNEVLGLIRSLTGEALRVRHEVSQNGDARDTSADTARARHDLGYLPSRSLPEGLRNQVDWHRASLATAFGTNRDR